MNAIQRTWIVDRPPNTSGAPLAYFVRPNRADGSSKTTRLLDFKRYAVPPGYSEHYVALIKRSLPLALPMNDDLKTFWHSVYKAIEPPAKDLKLFSDGSDFVAYVEGIKGKLLVLIDDIDRLATASPLVYRKFFRVLSVLHQSRPEFYAIAMGTRGIANLAITSSIEPFNLVTDSRVPYFSRSQVEDLFYEFQKDDHFILDPNVVSDIWSRSGGFRAQYRMASAFVDGFLCTKLLSAKYPIRPRDAPPVVDKKLVVLDAVKEAMCHFERDLLQDDIPRHVYCRVGKIPLNLDDYIWSVINDWYSNTIGMHSYITIKKGRPAVVIAVLATEDADSVHLRVLGLTEYKELLGADEAWLVHLTREDDYEPVWQSSDSLEKGVNVVHFRAL
ncbi:hypothetical protein EDD85DRAFT_935094 [Armillaria nabsnona]|nr:hypothetical protein EDD85DRAFT_935094 [Armillaria nabsnona]